MRLRVFLLMVLSGCATAPVAPAQEDPVRQRLAALPACQAGAEVGVLRVRPTLCTKKACEAACCNQCSWVATLETKSGQSAPVEPARVQALLGVGESGLDCEIAAWAEALKGLSVALDPSGCVVR